MALGIFRSSLVELAALLDIRVLQRSDDEILAQVPVTDGLKQPLGLVHGGVYATLADAVGADVRKTA